MKQNMLLLSSRFFCEQPTKYIKNLKYNIIIMYYIIISFTYDANPLRFLGLSKAKLVESVCTSMNWKYISIKTFLHGNYYVSARQAILYSTKINIKTNPDI
jgi:hypothetical protein